MKEKFLKIYDHNDLSNFFGMSYKELSAIIYPYNEARKYHSFSIQKRNGGIRTIKEPKKKLKDIQFLLKNVLSEIYVAKTPVHGFCYGKSIVTNAKMHLNKKFILNIDLSDFFGTIYFGRVKRLFMAKPFGFMENVATILAHICCFENSLPQGAPTSPIISNMIAFKMDAQLRDLAMQCQATYTRYADDITFSFTCSKRRLPPKIVAIDQGIIRLGEVLEKIIRDNGFKINLEKLRLAGITQRLEVTGITVNKFTNMPRKYVQQIKSMLYAWERFEYEAAEKEYLEKYKITKRIYESEEPFKYVVRGKIAFLKSVLGESSRIFNELALRFNKLVEEEFLKFYIPNNFKPRVDVISSLWIIETENFQGTGFDLDGFGVITCAHVIGDLKDKNIIYENIEAYKITDPTKIYKVTVIQHDINLDLATCTLQTDSGGSAPHTPMRISEIEPYPFQEVILYGFPNYAPGKKLFQADFKITSTNQTKSNFNFQRFEVDKTIRAGNSGGPLIDVHGDVIGIAVEGQEGLSGQNAAVYASELVKVFRSNSE